MGLLFRIKICGREPIQCQTTPIYMYKDASRFSSFARSKALRTDVQLVGALCARPMHHE